MEIAAEEVHVALPGAEEAEEMRDGAGGAQGVEVGFEVVEVEGRARGAAGHVFEDEQHDWARDERKAVCEEASGGA